MFECLYSGTRGPGKGQPLNATVWTPKGPVRIGKLKPGDTVFDGSGKHCEVVQVFDRGFQQIYEFQFDNDSSCCVDGEHLWLVFDVMTEEYKVVDTRVLLDKFHRPTFRFPIIHRLDFEAVDPLPVSPWDYGLEIGKTTRMFDEEKVLVRPQRERLNILEGFLAGLYTPKTSVGWAKGSAHGKLLRDLRLSLGLHPHTGEPTKFKKITRIRKLGREPTRCIAVNSPEQTYITNDFTITHNTDALLMSWAQYVGQGHGPSWRGILFRQSYPELSDVVSKTKFWFPKIWPGKASFNEQKMTWTMAGGEQLLLRHMGRADDYNSYHGHAYPWVGWEELTTWPDDVCYRLMMSCCRSTNPRIPRMYRATTNPYGVGHNWVKNRFRCRTMTPDNFIGPVFGDPPRCAIYGFVQENKILLHSDPTYLRRIEESARNPAERAAWLYGSWDIVSGGMFDDVWNPAFHVVRPFEIPPSWSINRSFDWGSSKPFSVGWWAESDGTDLYGLSTCRGDLYRIQEWYGWTGTPNEGCRMVSSEIAEGILEREKLWFPKRRVYAGPADNQIYTKIDNISIADEMARRGCHWQRSDKSPGSRRQGWQQMREMLKQAMNPRREASGLFVFHNCDHFLRTLPVLPRAAYDPEDIDTNSEDHVADESRYRVLTRPHKVRVNPIKGR